MKKTKKIVILIIVLLLAHGPVGGFFAQTLVSLGSYIGVCVGAIFSEPLRKDMNAIGFNLFNSSEKKVVNASAVSFYKGVPFFCTNTNRAGSFCAVLFSRENFIEEDVKHEVGHNVQQLILGPITFLALIGAPSMFELSTRDYYNRPWEVTADMFGGVSSRMHTKKDLTRGRAYIASAAIAGPFAYLFLIGEY